MENEIMETKVEELEPFAEDVEIVDESGNGGLLIGIGLGAVGMLGAQFVYKKAIKPLAGKVKNAVAGHKAKKAAKEGPEVVVVDDNVDEE